MSGGALFVLCMLLATISRSARGDESAVETPQRKSQIALATYYECVQTYALKYSKTSAPASDVAEAALSACANSARALFAANLAFVGSMENAQRLDGVAKDAARRWAIQSLLEARFNVK
jgi:hypothetical protein